MEIVESVVKVKGVEGTLAQPKVSTQDGAPRIVFIMHGLGGHRDYCYQALLGQEIPRQLGYATFRFDFRNCGESDPVPDIEAGRSIAVTDYEDIDAVVTHFCRDQHYEPLAMVGHSRGSTAMMYWLNRNHDSIFIPHIINCSGRFRTPMYYDRTVASHDGFLTRGGYPLMARRYGKYTDQWIPLKEVREFGEHDGSDFANIDSRVQFLTIFGSEDRHVPIADSAMWANQFYNRHVLKIVMGGDHNFYGPRVDGKKANYNPEVVEIALEYLSPEAESKRFYNTTKELGFGPRWRHVDGVENFRDFGGYGGVRTGVLYRSAAVGGLTTEGEETLRELRVKRIFDLRSIPESNRSPDPVVKGIQNVQAAVVKDADMSPQALARISAKMAEPNGGFIRNYLEMLVTGKEAYKSILLALRDFPGDAILVHCSAGKDRTGVICAMILLLMGVDSYTVAREYELTSIGFGPQLRVLAQAMRGSMEELGVSENQIAQLISSRYDAMRALIIAVNDKYGGAEGYFRDYCGLSKEDIAVIKKNLTDIPKPARSFL